MRSICINEFYNNRKRGRGGVDLTLRVKPAATRDFSYRQPYLWDDNAPIVVLISMSVRYIGTNQSHDLVLNLNVSICSNSTCDVTFLRAYTISRRHTSYMYILSLRYYFIAESHPRDTYANRSVQNHLNMRCFIII